MKNNQVWNQNFISEKNPNFFLRSQVQTARNRKGLRRTLLQMTLKMKSSVKCQALPYPFYLYSPCHLARSANNAWLSTWLPAITSQLSAFLGTEEPCLLPSSNEIAWLFGAEGPGMVPSTMSTESDLPWLGQQFTLHFSSRLHWFSL